MAICPPRPGNRKGVVEKANHTAAQRWWRTLPDDVTVEQAQARWTGSAAVRGDTRLRRDQRTAKATVATVAAAGTAAAGAAGAVPGDADRDPGRVAQALVAFRGNRYSVPPELAAATVTVSPAARRRRSSTSPPPRGS